MKTKPKREGSPLPSSPGGLRGPDEAGQKGGEKMDYIAFFLLGAMVGWALGIETAFGFLRSRKQFKSGKWVFKAERR